MDRNINDIYKNINNKLDKDFHSQNRFKSILKPVGKKLLGEKKLLYKYVSRLKGYYPVYQAIKQSRIWFNPANQCNDPFECMSISGVFPRTVIEQRLRTFLNIAENEPFSIDDSYYEILLQHTYTHFMINTLARYGVLCLSAAWQSLTMWSHYASNHEGVVLIFEYDVENSFYQKLRSVKYKDDNHYFLLGEENSESKIWESITTKHSSWATEEEYRIIKPPSKPNQSDGAGMKEFPKEILKGVIFGLRCKEETIRKIKKWGRKRSPELKYFRAIMPDPFNISIDIISE